MEKIYTGNAHSIDEVAEFLHDTPDHTLKTLVYLADGKPVIILMRGNDNLNEIKLQHVLDCETLVMASDAAIEEIMGSKPGSVGPCHISIPTYADFNVVDMHDVCCGANEADHLIRMIVRSLVEQIQIEFTQIRFSRFPTNNNIPAFRYVFLEPSQLIC